MNTYNKVPEVPIKTLNQTKKASSRRAMILKDLIPMLHVYAKNQQSIEEGTCIMMPLFILVCSLNSHRDRYSGVARVISLGGGAK